MGAEVLIPLKHKVRLSTFNSHKKKWEVQFFFEYSDKRPLEDGRSVHQLPHGVFLISFADGSGWRKFEILPNPTIWIFDHKAGFGFLKKIYDQATEDVIDEIVHEWSEPYEFHLYNRPNSRFVIRPI